MIEVAELDKSISFLRDEAKRLRDTQGKVQWALTKANRFDEIADQLVLVRREKQMTSIGGKRLQDNGE